MKKRILALALAAATAFSMFGASLSVGAEAYDAYKPYTPVDVGTLKKEDASKLTETNKEAADTLADQIIFASSDTTEISSEVVYAYDYNSAALTEAKTKAQAYLNNPNKKTYTAFKTAADALADAKVKGVAYPEASVDRIAAYKAVVDLKGKVDAAKDMIGDTDYKDYKLEELNNDIGKATDTTPTSQLYALKEAYDYYDSLFSFSSVKQKDYEKLYAEVSAYEADDYSGTAYDRVLNYISIAEGFAADGDYTNAIAALNSAKAVGFKTPDKTELKATLASMFTDGKILSTYSGTDKTCLYQKEDYDTTAKDDAWDVLVNGYEDVDGTWVASVYSKAYTAYRTSGKRQSEVNAANEALLNALADLGVTNAAPNYDIVKLEEYVAMAEAVESTDYKTNSTVWKAFEKALTTAQDVLAKDVPGKSEVTAAINGLAKYVDGGNGLDGIIVSNTTARNNLKKAIKEAEALLKDTSDMTEAQVASLKVAIANAKTVANDAKLKTISSMTNAQAALEDAVTASQQALGWVQLSNGTWMYGTEDGYVTSNWKWIGSAWYYFDAKGIMVTGWQWLDGAWYYFYNWGGMAKGWALVNGTWYYLNPNGGKMLANDWYWIDGKCYYFYSTGAMAANTTIDGYKVDASGAWVK